MNLSEITHRSIFTDCYALDEDTIKIRIQTGKDVDAIYLLYGDPYVAGQSGYQIWRSRRSKLQMEYELRHYYIWSITVTPEFKREQYYFELHSNEEMLYLLEDDLYEQQELTIPKKMLQYFKFPWLNSSDVFTVPSWASNTIWYQILPDRFCRGSQEPKRMETKCWRCEDAMTYWDHYGGDLTGINHRLDYLRDLGVTGLYLTPLFTSPSNHKYDTSDYTTIDPDFGTEEIWKDVINEAHKRGIRIMMDAVFNHCGKEFFAWKDVMEQGRNSPYFNWFYIQQWPLKQDDSRTLDGRYFSFAFEARMPKLNTNNPEVIEYLSGLCHHWVTDFQIDGIRFDVGNEISHHFIKQLRHELKQLNPDLFLVGEIWNDAAQWLQGDEYDSVMNYPLLSSIHDFFLDTRNSAADFMYSINHCYSLYCDQVNSVLFNLLDSHDVSRAYTRCGNMDIFFAQLVLLFTLEGSPCIYYGTELAMEGAHNPLNRKCMPWDEIGAGTYNATLLQVKQLIGIRKQYPQTRSNLIDWHVTNANRLIHYSRRAKDSREVLEVYINADVNDIALDNADTVLYSRNYEAPILKSKGVIIWKHFV